MLLWLVFSAILAKANGFPDLKALNDLRLGKNSPWLDWYNKIITFCSVSDILDNQVGHEMLVPHLMVVSTCANMRVMRICLGIKLIFYLNAKVLVYV